jgi:myo-inositol-1(or 4)-monophosphatase
MYNNEERAIKFIIQAFKGNKNKIDNMEKCFHSILVGNSIKEITKAEEIVIAAYLHNVINYTEYGYEDIEDKFGCIVADIVSEISEDWSLSKWIDRKKEFIKRIKQSNDINNINIIIADKTQDLLSYKEYFKKKNNKLWKELNASKSDITWFYRELYNIALNKGTNQKLLNRYKEELIFYFGDII